MNSNDSTPETSVIREITDFKFALIGLDILKTDRIKALEQMTDPYVRDRILDDLKRIKTEMDALTPIS